MTSARPGSLYSEFFRRLRARPLSSWSINNRAAIAQTAAAELATLGWAQLHPTGQAPPVPDLGPHALADQLEVLLVEAERTGADPAVLRRLIVDLAQTLSVRLD